MSSSLIHYADIYDLDDKKHSEPRWSGVDQMWRYYEGYGQGACSEKRDFLVSVNRDHELWSGETPEREVGCRVFTRDEHIDRMLTESDVGRQVDFLTETWDGMDRGLPQGSEPTFVLDGRDREDRLSWNFSKMLADYCEKAHGIEEKEKFFKFGGAGERWGKDKAVMKEFKAKFEYLENALKDKDFKISLSDQSVKDYPLYHYERLYGRYKDFMKSGERLNPNASVFIPGNTATAKLARVAPMKICGVHSVGPCILKPMKPGGPPPPRRPTASSKDSGAMMAWSIKSEADARMGQLEKKLDYLIQMNGPIVNAEVV
jgi:hypothetical protein